MIKLFIFDLGKVLVDFDFKIAVRALKQFGPIDPIRMNSLFRNSQLSKDWDSGLLNPNDFFRIVRQELSLNCSQEEFVPIWNNIFQEIDGMVPWVQQLQQEFQVSILSNTNPWHAEFLRKRYPWLEGFDDFIASCDVHLLKPDPKIYDLALDRAGVKPSETIYVDDMNENIQSAQGLGIYSILFEGHKKLLQSLQKCSIEKRIPQLFFPTPSLVPEI